MEIQFRKNDNNIVFSKLKINELRNFYIKK